MESWVEIKNEVIIKKRNELFVAFENAGLLRVHADGHVTITNGYISDLEHRHILRDVLDKHINLYDFLDCISHCCDMKDGAAIWGCDEGKIIASVGKKKYADINFPNMS